MEPTQIQQWARERIEELPGAVLTRPFGDEHEVYRVSDKIFMMLTEKPGRPIVTLKARVADSALLREAFTQIIPGWHMNKRHWITLDPGPELERGMVRDLVTESYLLIVENLPARLRPVDPERFGQAASDATAEPLTPPHSSPK